MSRRIDVDEYRTWILTRLHSALSGNKEIAFDVYATSTILQWHLESLCWIDNSQDVWERFRIYWDKDYFDLHSLAASGPRLANNILRSMALEAASCMGYIVPERSLNDEEMKQVVMSAERLQNAATVSPQQLVDAIGDPSWIIGSKTANSVYCYAHPSAKWVFFDFVAHWKPGMAWGDRSEILISIRDSWDNSPRFTPGN